MKLKHLPRRDQVYLVGRRMMKMRPSQRLMAWELLALRLQVMGSEEQYGLPKYRDLVKAIRLSTIYAKNIPKDNYEQA